MRRTHPVARPPGPGPATGPARESRNQRLPQKETHPVAYRSRRSVPEARPDRVAQVCTGREPRLPFWLRGVTVPDARRAGRQVAEARANRHSVQADLPAVQAYAGWRPGHVSRVTETVGAWH